MDGHAVQGSRGDGAGSEKPPRDGDNVEWIADLVDYYVGRHDDDVQLGDNGGPKTLSLHVVRKWVSGPPVLLTRADKISSSGGGDDDDDDDDDNDDRRTEKHGRPMSCPVSLDSTIGNLVRLSANRVAVARSCRCDEPDRCTFYSSVVDVFAAVVRASFGGHLRRNRVDFFPVRPAGRDDRSVAPKSVRDRDAQLTAVMESGERKGNGLVTRYRTWIPFHRWRGLKDRCCSGTSRSSTADRKKSDTFRKQPAASKVKHIQVRYTKK